MKTKKAPASSIVFYVIAVILLMAFAFQLYYTYDTVKASGLTFSAEWKSIVPFYIAQTALPFIGTVVTYGIGLILAKLPSFEVVAVTTSDEVKVEDEAMEELVSSLKDAKAQGQTKKEETKKEETKKEEVKEEVKEEKAVKADKKQTNKKANAKKKEEVKKEEVKEEVKIEEVKEETKEAVVEEVKADETSTDKVEA